MNCPKHVEYYSNNKFEKLVHLVGFIIRFYDDARSLEREMRHMIVSTFLTGRYETVLKHRCTTVTVTEVPLEQLKFQTTGAERFEHRCSSSAVKMYSRHLTLILLTWRIG